MDFKQLTYSSLEKGWGIDRVIGNVTEKERDAFAGLCASADVPEPVYALDINKGFYVLSCCSPYGTDTFGRQRTYTHGYTLPLSDADELFKNKGVLLGISYFATRADDELMPFEGVLPQFSGEIAIEEHRKLIECVYEAIIMRKHLEIVSAEENKVLFIKKVMNAVYDYLPLSLKKFVTFSAGAKSAGRTVNVMDEFSKNAELTYDFINNKASGLTGLWTEYTEMLFTDKREHFISKLEGKLYLYTENKVLEKSFYRKAIDAVLSESIEQETEKKSTLVEKLIGVIQKNDLTIEKNALLAGELIKGIVSEKTVCAAAMYEKLSELYGTVNNEFFRTSIVELFVQRYCVNCTVENFDEFFEYYSKARELFVQTTEKAMRDEIEAFIELCAEKALGNDVLAKFIKNNCDKICTECISAVILRKITENPTDMILNQTILSAFHEVVVAWLLKFKTDKEIMWKYFTAVYSSKERFDSYLNTDSSVYDALESLFCDIAGEKVTESVLMLKLAYLNIGKNGYLHIADNLKATRAVTAVEHFYAQVLLPEVKNRKQIENLKQELIKLDVSTEGFVKAALEIYAEFCVKEQSENKRISVSDMLEQIKSFSGEFITKQIGGIDFIKETFWKHFKFGRIRNLSNDIRFMSLPDNPVSDFANALLNLTEYISGKAESFSDSDFEICKKNLCTKDSVLTLKTKSSILRQLRILLNKCDKETDIDLYFLINYSPVTRRVILKNAILTASEIRKYLKKKDSMLSVDGVFRSLFGYVKRKESKKKKSDIRSSFEYGYLLRCMRKDSVNPIDAENCFYKGNTKALYMFLCGLCAMIGALVMHYLRQGSLMAGYTTAIALSVTQIAYIKFCTDKKILHRFLNILIADLIILLYGLYFIIF